MNLVDSIHLAGFVGCASIFETIIIKEQYCQSKSAQIITQIFISKSEFYYIAGVLLKAIRKIKNIYASSNTSIPRKFA